MKTLTQRYADGLEMARRKRFPEAQLVLCGRHASGSRGHLDLLTIATGWNANYLTHELQREATFKRERTLDFFIAARPELTEGLLRGISSVKFDGKRYNLATEPRMQLGFPSHTQIICHPTGEAAV